jgi:hypothetical protein
LSNFPDDCSGKALAADPRNPVALKNLSAILVKEGDSLRLSTICAALSRSIPRPAQTVYGLVLAR